MKKTLTIKLLKGEKRNKVKARYGQSIQGSLIPLGNPCTATLKGLQQWVDQSRGEKVFSETGQGFAQEEPGLGSGG